MRLARREVTCSDSCNEPLPLTVVVTVQPGEIGSLAFRRSWSSMDVAMSRAELERVRDAINAVLVATEPSS